MAHHEHEEDLKRITTVVAPNELASDKAGEDPIATLLPPDVPDEAAASDAEAVILDGELVAANGVLERLCCAQGMSYRETQELLAQDCQDRVAEVRQHLQKMSLDNITWQNLADLELLDPPACAAKWQSIREMARHEIETGHRGGQVVRGLSDTPMDRARYLALEHELGDGWQPRNGIERSLLSQMAQAYTFYEMWMNTLTVYSMARAREISKDEARWEAPRLDGAEALERAAAMADRFQRMFVRAQRALRDMRRYAPVIVQNAGQVNVGEQQINVAPADAPPQTFDSPP